MRAFTWLGRLSVALAILAAATSLFCKYAVNAQSLGAHDLKIAIVSATVGAIAVMAMVCALPVLLVIGAIAWFFQRQSAYCFFAAIAICLVPLTLVLYKL
jgi:hypothetical protein